MNLAAFGALTCTATTIATVTHINAATFALGKDYRKYFTDWTIDCSHNKIPFFIIDMLFKIL